MYNHITHFYRAVNTRELEPLSLIRLKWLISTFEQSLPASMAPSSKNTTMEQQSEVWHLRGQ